MATRRRLVLFDIDGTILLTAGAGRRAILAAIAEEVGDVAVQALCSRYVTLLQHELRQPSSRTTVMPGVFPLLDRLEREEGVVLGLLTGNMLQGAALKLRAAGLEPARFRVGAYGSDAAHRPELPAIAARRAEPYFGRIPAGPEVVIIGDTPADCGGDRCLLGR